MKRVIEASSYEEKREALYLAGKICEHIKACVENLQYLDAISSGEYQEYVEGVLDEFNYIEELTEDFEAITRSTFIIR